MGKRPLRCAGYIRVSTESQAMEGVSLEAQAERVRAYAVVKGWVLSEILQDEASAKDLERPGVLNLLNLVRKRAVDVIIVTALDRLTRSLVDLPAILKLLEQSGVELVSISESLDTTNATGRLMLNLLVSVSAWEREVIGERTALALRSLRGRLEVFGPTPFGFTRERGRLVPNSTELRWIERMKAWRAAKVSYAAIAERLNEQKVPTKTKGAHWYASGVRYILQNNIYSSVLKHNGAAQNRVQPA